MCKNLLRNGFKVTAIYDLNPDKCAGFADDIKVKSSPKEVAEESEIIISGIDVQFMNLKVLKRVIFAGKYITNV